jgi:ketosteroid isomerase-like protein
LAFTAEPRVELIGGVALVALTFRWTRVSGGAESKWDCRYTAVARKTGGQWHLAWEHMSLPLAG